ncbi:MAG: hypothetical protein JW915_16485 [Chitinispirillaceae bacterium]|nr:hypothetical protein [Chitinispirillaceae bacterium]
MIRINLLKSAARKKAKPGNILTPKVMIIALIAVICGIGAFLGITLKPVRKPARTAAPTVAVTVPPPVPVRSGPDMIEEVVKEIGERHNEPARLNIPYPEMTFLEKVNYEALFARQVFLLLSRAIPPGIGLKMLEVDNFLTVYATGVGDSRELISSTFTALKNEKLEILSQPHSYISANGSKGYKFVVTCKADFGIDHGDPFQAWEHIDTRENIPFIIKKISEIGVANKISFKGKPVQTSAEDVGLYRRYIYSFKGKGEYKSFVSLILGLYTEKIPCAFKKVVLNAGTGTDVDIAMDILLTLKE